jgi:two-component system response regulator YesN
MKKLSRTKLGVVLYIGITMLIVILSLSGIFYAMVEKEGLSYVNRRNSDLLNAAGFHMSYVNEVGKSFCTMQFNDSEVQTLLIGTGTADPILAGQVVQRMRRFMQANEMLENIFLYNGRTGMCFGTAPLLSDSMKGTVSCLTGNTENTGFMVIPRKITNEATGKIDHTVLTYIAAERDPASGKILSAVSADVSSSWLADHIAPQGDIESGHMMLVNEHGQILLDTSDEAENSADIRTLEAPLYTEAERHTGGSFIRGNDVISVKRVEGTDWLLLNIEPYAALFAFINLLRSRIMLAVLLSLLIGVPVTVAISNLIYKPIDSLFRHIRETSAAVPASGGPSENEIAYLQNVYDRQNSQLRKSRLSAVLTDSDLHAADEIFLNFGSRFRNGESAGLLLLNIYDEHNAEYENSGKEKDLIRFSVCNIAEELLGQLGPAETTLLSGEKIAVLVALPESVTESDVREMAEELAKKSAGLLNISLSVFFAITVCDRQSLNATYRKLNALTRYRLIFGPDCVFGAEDLSERQKTVAEYPKETEKSLLDAISRADSADAAEYLDRFLSEAEKGSADGFLSAVTQLGLTLRDYVRKINEHKLVKISADFEPIRRLPEAESKKQIRGMLSELIEEITGQIPYDTKQKNSTIVDTVCHYVDENYTSRDLCSKFLASMMGISVGYLNMLFKESMACGVCEYINRVRLEHAQELVLHTNQQISRIIESCGLETSSFYRLYKARFGVSPKEQRMQQKLKA